MRKGITLIETLIAIGIFAVLVSLLLPAIWQIRKKAMLTATQNKQKQIVLASMNYSANNSQLIPYFSEPTAEPDSFATPHTKILPYLCNYVYPIHSVNLRTINHTPPELRDVHDLAAFIFPKISYDSPEGFKTEIWDIEGTTSFVFNKLCVEKPTNYVGVTDGSSNTILVSYKISQSTSLGQTSCFFKPTDPYILRQPPDYVPVSYRRATFADSLYKDVVPTRTNQETKPSTSGKTFEYVTDFGRLYEIMHPKESEPLVLNSSHAEITSRIPTTPFRQGLPVVFADGSLRMLRPEINEQVFWAHVTPNWGDLTTNLE